MALAPRELGRQYVTGETIDGAMRRAAGMTAQGYTHSGDMLGEAARARAYHLRHSGPIPAIARPATQGPAGIGFDIDAEEADPGLAGRDATGVVVQAHGNAAAR